jgi:hypothetical protein
MHGIVKIHEKYVLKTKKSEEYEEESELNEEECDHFQATSKTH